MTAPEHAPDPELALDPQHAPEPGRRPARCPGR